MTLEELGHQLGLRPEGWLDWVTCTPDWIVEYIWYFGAYVAVAYLLFATLALVLEWGGDLLLKVSYFFLNLGVVFLLCSAVHFIHVESRYEPDYLVLLVFFYPVLAVLMTSLIYFTIQVWQVSKNLISRDKYNKAIEEKDAEIERLNTIVSQHQITQQASEIAKRKLEILQTLGTITDREHIIVEGKDWEIEISYTHWVTYVVNGVKCRLIGIYLNDTTTAIINEFLHDDLHTEMYFPPHAHKYSETVIPLTGVIEMNGMRAVPAQSLTFPGGILHDLRTDISKKNTAILVIWNEKFDIITANH